MDINFKKYIIPDEIHQWTMEEESKMFPPEGTECLFQIDGDFKIGIFSFYYSSFKYPLNENGEPERKRDGNGELYFRFDLNDDIVISNGSSILFKEYWAICT